MSGDKDDIFVSADWRIDHTKFAPLIDSATEIAKLNPLEGLSSVLGVGLEIEKSLAKTAGLVKMLKVPDFSPDLVLGESLSSLSRLKVPYEVLTGLDISASYRGTIDSLASIGAIADGITQFKLPSLDKYRPESVIPEDLKFPSLDLPGYKFTHDLTSPYIATAASALSLESSYASLFESETYRDLITGLSLESVDYVRGNVASLSTSLRATWDMLGSREAAWNRISLPMLQRPAIECYTDIHAMGAITLIEEKQPLRDDEIEEWLSDRVSTFEFRLGSLDGNLVEPYVGAIASIQSGKPDWQRHSMTSFRELTMHVLHKLAPDEEVKKTAMADDLHEGRPTRRARLKYIFADAAGPELVEFFEADINAALELFNLLNSGTHRLGSKATPAQLHYIRCRVVGLIGSMLEVQGY